VILRRRRNGLQEHGPAIRLEVRHVAESIEALAKDVEPARRLDGELPAEDEDAVLFA
jgi:hypothetical protein